MASYKIEMDAVSISKIIALIDAKRSREDSLKLVTILNELMKTYGIQEASKFIKALKVLGEYGIRPDEAVLVIQKVAEALK